MTHVVISLDVGGLERIVLDLVREGRNLDQEVSVACLERPGVLAADAESLGARVLSAGKRPGLRPGTIGRLASALQDLRPDVIHTHQVGALVYAGPASRRAGAPPIIHTEHGKHYASRLRTRLLGRFGGRYVDRFACVSGDIATEVEQYRVAPRSKIVVVPNGIDTDRRVEPSERDAARMSLGIPAGVPVVGTVGRLHEVKRQDRLLRVFADVARAVPEAHLVLVGDGPLMPDLRLLAETLGVASWVHFVGYQSQPEKYLAMMDVFALTSRSEGMPLSVLEAWAAGVPVVASRVGGLPELVSDGESGLLFDDGDEAALTHLLLDMISNPTRRLQLAETGRKTVVQSYSLRTMAMAYHRQYQALLGIDGSPNFRQDLS